MVFSQKLYSHRIFKPLAKALIRLRICAGWSEPLLVAHITLLEITCHGSYHECERRVDKSITRITIRYQEACPVEKSVIMWEGFFYPPPSTKLCIFCLDPFQFCILDKHLDIPEPAEMHSGTMALWHYTDVTWRPCAWLPIQWTYKQHVMSRVR